jgi:TRAP-type C4-dicarboxylate transport system permease small subunit
MLRKLMRHLNQILPLIGGAIIFYGCFELFTRIAFQFQHMWINDLLLFVMVSVLWFSSINLIKNSRETSIDMIVVKLHGRKKIIYQIILDLISCVGCLLLGLSGFALVGSLMQLGLDISTVFPVPEYVPVICFAIAMIGCSVMFCLRIIKSIRQLKGT